MFTKRMLSLLFPPMLLLSGCAEVHMREDTAPPPAYAPRAEYATQVALGECAFTSQEETAAGAIAGALLANAVSAGINRIGAALTEAAKEKTLSTKTSRNVEVTADTFGPCVQVVRGWFYQDPFPIGKDDPFAGNPKFTAAQTWFSPDFINLERFRALWLRNQLWLAAPPDFLFEGRIMTASKNALTIAPQYVRMNEPLFTRTLRRDPSRYVAVFLAFHKPDTSVDAEASPGASFIIGKLTPGEARTFPDPRTITRFTPKTGVVNRWPHESEWFTLAVGQEKEPWIVSAAVTEKQDGNEFLAFVAEVFSGAKETITTEVQNVVVPEKRAAAKEAAASAQETAASGFDQAQVGALTALAACTQADSPTAQQASDARSALRELNKAARAANKEEPASQACINSIGITAVAATIKSACGAAQAKITAGQRC